MTRICGLEKKRKREGRAGQDRAGQSKATQRFAMEDDGTKRKIKTALEREKRNLSHAYRNASAVFVSLFFFKENEKKEEE